MTIYIEVDKSFAKLYDELIYTLTIKNEGQNIDSLCIVNPFNEVVTFKEVKVNESVYNDKNILAEGFFLKNLQRWEEVKVVFVGMITDFPRENPITHIADVYYNVGKEAYMLTSNAVMTYVVDANITYQSGGFLLEADKMAVNRGEVITYKLLIMNKGNRVAEQLLVGPIVPLGTQLLEERIKCLEERVNLTQEGSIYIEGLDVGEVRTYFYTVKVEDFLSVEGITQALHMYYRLTYPNRQCVIQRSTTNCVDIPIETVYFKGKEGALRKKVSRVLATEGDLLTYTFEGYNAGTVRACQIYILDDLPEGTRWVEGSLLINGQNEHSIQKEPSEKGKRIEISVPDCLPNECFSISYQVEIIGELPVPEVLQTTLILNYWYGVGERMVEEEVYVQAEATHVVLAYIDPLNKHLIEGLEEVITLGETVAGSLSFMNKGNVQAEHIDVELELPKGILLRGKGWIEEGGKLHKSYLIPLEPQGSYTENLSFEVVDIQGPLQTFINVQIIYTYKVGEGRVEKVSAQEEIPISIEVAYIDARGEEGEKYFYPKEVCVGEEVYCTFNLTNTGNLPAHDLIIQEENLEALHFLEPGSGKLYLEKLEPKETQAMTYRAQIIALPPDGTIMPLSQISYGYTTYANKYYTKEIGFKQAAIQVVDAYVSPFINEEGVQQVERKYYAKGERVHYTLPITNLGNVPAENITVNLPELACGIWHNNKELMLNQLMPGECQHLSYELEITQIPDTGLIKLAPLLSYMFQMKDYKNSQRRTIERSYALDPIEVAVHYAAIEEEYGLVRSVDQTVTALDEVVYYTVNLKNLGNVKALEVHIQENASEGCIYESGTLTLNGVEIEGNPLWEHVFLGTLEPGESYSIRYGVKVNQVPIEGEFYTRSILNYSYYVGTDLRSQQVVTNPINVQVEDADIQLVIGVDGYNLMEQSIDLDEGFNFDVTVDVKGNTQACNLYYFIESEGISFEPAFGVRPMQIPSLSSKEIMVISAVGKVKQFVPDGKLCIRGKLCYEFGLGPRKRQRTIYTEEQNLYIYAAGPQSPKAFGLDMSQKVVHLEESITLTFWLLGEGNCPMEQAMLSLKGFEAVGFKVEKVYSDEEALQLKSIGEALSLGSIYPGERKLITVEGVMTCIPKEARCEYEGVLTYNYLSATSKGRKKACHLTEKGTFIFRESGLGQEGSMTLSSDKASMRKDESILYTLKVENRGNVKTKKIKIQLAIDERLEVDTAPYSVRGGAYTGDLVSGLYIEQLACGEWVEIQFQGSLKALMPKEDLEVAGTVIYEYEDGEDILKVCEKEVPPCFVSIESADFGRDYFAVVVDKKEVAQGQVVNCQIHCQNGGNKKAEGVRLHVELPSTFDYVQPAFYNKDKIDKKGQIEIGTLGPMEKRVITFNLAANHFTSPFQEDFISTRLTYKDKGEQIQHQPIFTPLYCVCPRLEMVWQLDTEHAIVGEIVRCTLQMTNVGNRRAEGVSLTKWLCEEMTYVEGSLKINGQEIEILSLDVLQLETIEQNQMLTITFSGKINLMPPEGRIKHKAQIMYHYTLNNKVEEVVVESESMQLLIEAPHLDSFKKCDKQKVKVGEEIEINVKLVNTGSIHLDQVIFYDPLQEGILFVEGSFKRDGKRQGVVDLGTGVGLGPLKRKGQLLITYKLRVQSYKGPEWIHEVYTEYLFNKANLKISKKKSDALVDTLKVSSPYQVPLVYETQIFLPHDAPDLYEILNVEVTAEILEANTLLDHPKEAEVKGILNYSVSYRGGGENRQVKVKKVWGKRMNLSYASSKESLNLQVETEKIHYAIVHKRALKVEVHLSVSEI